MFHLNFYLWFVDLWFTLWYGLCNWLSVKYQDTVNCNSLSASTTVVKISLHRQMRGWFFSFSVSESQFVCMAASLPYIIHFSLVHFLRGDGWGGGGGWIWECLYIWMTALLMRSVRWHSKWRKGGGSMGLKMLHLWMSTFFKSKFHFSVPAGCVFSVICFAWLCAFCPIV